LYNYITYDQNLRLIFTNKKETFSNEVEKNNQ
jgi:hypothetical protein